MMKKILLFMLIVGIVQGCFAREGDPIYWDISHLQRQSVSIGVVFDIKMNQQNNFFWYAYTWGYGFIAEVLLALIPLDREVANIPLRVQADIKDLEHISAKNKPRTMFKVYTRVIPQTQHNTQNIPWIEQKQELFTEPIEQVASNIIEVGVTSTGNPIIFLKNITDLETGYLKNQQLEFDMKKLN